MEPVRYGFIGVAVIVAALVIFRMSQMMLDGDYVMVVVYIVALVFLAYTALRALGQPWE